VFSTEEIPYIEGLIVGVQVIFNRGPPPLFLAYRTAPPYHEGLIVGVPVIFAGLPPIPFLL
jgi:hypothetical protein